jgi:hypothetical protein
MREMAYQGATGAADTLRRIVTRQGQDRRAWFQLGPCSFGPYWNRAGLRPAVAVWDTVVAGKQVPDAGWESALPEVAAVVEEVPGRSQREQAWGSAAPGASGSGGSLQVLRETRRHGCRREAQDREQARAGCGVEGGASRNLVGMPAGGFTQEAAEPYLAARPGTGLVQVGENRLPVGHRLLRATIGFH